ncbi:OLC1v1009991C1 [Oldenlandia corymbosa var. corymbosa]|uniref:OLC1v1009991C1 n=1 Tax=Oldenlandia corymbosa var. corymbosa TaxID=529605 RepID=A0AAV1DQA1_OLDCO|nr:OLC1v1009991C1 [Oldenlandia corymbosa var. corymbosa]
MEKANRKKKWPMPLGLLLLIFLFSAEFYSLLSIGQISRWLFLRMDSLEKTSSPPRMFIHDRHVVMDNGLVRVTISTPGGMLTKINYKGHRNVLNSRVPESQRGYWDLVWSRPGQVEENFLKLRSKDFEVIAQDDNQIELSFKSTYDPSLDHNGTDLPLNVDKRFVLMRGMSGFYSYAIYERLKGWPALNIFQTRLTFKLDKTRGSPTRSTTCIQRSCFVDKSIQSGSERRGG